MTQRRNPYDAFLREARIGSIAYIYLPDFCWQSAGEVFEFLRRLKPGLSYATLKVLLNQWTRKGLVVRTPITNIRDGRCGSGAQYLYRRSA
jgi:hypothetical protein